MTIRRLKSVAIVGLCLGLLVSGCGRKAGLETPTSATPDEAELGEVAANGTAAADTADADDGSATEQQETSRFFLDRLIGANTPDDTEETDAILSQPDADQQETGLQ